MKLGLQFQIFSIIKTRIKGRLLKMSNRRKWFVQCTNPKCTCSWNINVRRDCPVCGHVYNKNEIVINTSKPETTASEIQNKMKGKAKVGKKKGKKAKTTTVVRQPTDFAWEAKIETVTACSKAPEKITIWITPTVKEKTAYLMKKFTNLEWLAYLLGEKKEDGSFLVNDIFLPKQRVSGASVDNVDCPEYNQLPVVGVMHSHHNMGHNFSHTDDEWINQNHDLSIVVSKTGFGGQARYKMPCGAYKIIDVKVKLKINSSVDFDDFQKQIDEKIEKQTYNIYNQYGHNNRWFYQGQDQNWDENGYPVAYPPVVPGRQRFNQRKKTFTDGAITKEVEEKFTPKKQTTYPTPPATTLNFSNSETTEKIAGADGDDELWDTKEVEETQK